jgi:hypothetical protein
MLAVPDRYCPDDGHGTAAHDGFVTDLDLDSVRSAGSDEFTRDVQVVVSAVEGENVRVVVRRGLPAFIARVLRIVVAAPAR